MFFSERAKGLPYLTDYLQQASDKKQGQYPVLGVAGDVIGSAGFGLAVGFSTFLFEGANSLIVPLYAGAMVFLMGAVNAYRIAKLKADKLPKTEEDQLEIQAAEVTGRMKTLLEKRRLHRDLSGDVAALLEEAATQWSRCKTALLSPYWTKDDLSPQLKNIRQQSLAAVERSMQELMVLFATSVPEQPGNWNLAEVVDEVVGKNMFAGAPNRRLTMFYSEGLRVVQRLSELADESERISIELMNDPTRLSGNRPGSAIEATLAELRSLQQAEDELRENLNH
ncbi:hypothetical protein BH11ARM1_BH11ARM1_10910 [soil metagenome]